MTLRAVVVLAVVLRSAGVEARLLLLVSLPVFPLLSVQFDEYETFACVVSSP